MSVDQTTITTPALPATQVTVTGPAQVEQTALQSRDAGLAVWGLVYIVVIAVLATGGYLLISAVSQHNSQAGQWFVAGVLFIAGLIVPSPTAALLRK